MDNSDKFWEILSWDTEFFGIKTGRIIPMSLKAEQLALVLNECCAKHVKVLYYLSESNDEPSNRLAQAAGFNLVDIRITFEWLRKKGNTTPQVPKSTSVIRDHRGSDIPMLQDIARNSYHHTRYYYDRHYPRERCDQLYAEWIAQSCNLQAQKVLVIERDDQVQGYVTCILSSDNQVGQIGLVGIRADARGLGLGRMLVHAAQDWFNSKNVEAVTVVTQGRNIEAQRLYQRCGFVTKDVQLWYHKWFDETSYNFPEEVAGTLGGNL